jgi:hypothetical protein
MSRSTIRRGLKQLKQLEASLSLFAPTPDEYPQGSDSDGDIPTRTRNQPLSSRITSLSISSRLATVQCDVENWHFVANFEDLPDTVWRLWSRYKFMGIRDRFDEAINADIEEADALLSKLIEVICEVGLDIDLNSCERLDFLTQISKLQSKVHRARAELQVRRDLVRSGMATRYPLVLCPQAPDNQCVYNNM